ncbi:MAG: hypothetical protein OEN01_03940 [Candidatus Krumholzibacteria bacterium]|nr:hypothetical protein [Candidatus Krumholzibacteria bacterium]
MSRLGLIIMLLTLTIYGTAVAQGGPFGLGIIIGEPTGIGGKYYLTRSNAIDGAVAWSLEGDNDFHIQGDYLYHNYSLIEVDRGELPLYFGVGGRIAFRENRDDLVGVRFPVGLDYIFENAPVDIFGEIVPILDLAPDTDFDLEGAIGARFFF